ncbi:SRPBCC domain-containing protein [Ruegeria sp. R14_0]|uniref:SRPBCC family protein n=1 Tax=Ruegeria sp. R14_0 TaxID=2821100 RepID=UPI001ADA5057|nr:SRPBCC domain-containing protein [Ruegeria sp. R14_0]MBO9446261.1 SRPBCC domain-containing protein [Ruegeria sp. R14_0]
MTNSILQKAIFLRAEPETVWAFLTEPDRLAEWFHKPEHPLTAGQKLKMFGTTSGDLLIWGEVRAARRPEYLEYTFTIKPLGDTVSVVKWTLDAVPGGTRLGLVHEGLPQNAEAFGLILSLDSGWDEHFDKMRKALHEPVDA